MLTSLQPDVIHYESYYIFVEFSSLFYPIIFVTGNLPADHECITFPFSTLTAMESSSTTAVPDVTNNVGVNIEKEIQIHDTKGIKNEPPPTLQMGRVKQEKSTFQAVHDVNASVGVEKAFATVYIRMKTANVTEGLIQEHIAKGSVVYTVSRVNGNDMSVEVFGWEGQRNDVYIFRRLDGSVHMVEWTHVAPSPAQRVYSGDRRAWRCSWPIETWTPFPRPVVIYMSSNLVVGRETTVEVTALTLKQAQLKGQCLYCHTMPVAIDGDHVENCKKNIEKMEFDPILCRRYLDNEVVEAAKQAWEKNHKKDPKLTSLCHYHQHKLAPPRKGAPGIVGTYLCAGDCTYDRCVWRGWEHLGDISQHAIRFVTKGANRRSFISDIINDNTTAAEATLASAKKEATDALIRAIAGGNLNTSENGKHIVGILGEYEGIIDRCNVPIPATRHRADLSTLRGIVEGVQKAEKEVADNAVTAYYKRHEIDIHKIHNECKQKIAKYKEEKDVHEASLHEKWAAAEKLLQEQFNEKRIQESKEYDERAAAQKAENEARMRELDESWEKKLQESKLDKKPDESKEKQRIEYERKLYYANYQIDKLKDETEKLMLERVMVAMCNMISNKYANCAERFADEDLITKTKNDFVKLVRNACGVSDDRKWRWRDMFDKSDRNGPDAFERLREDWEWNTLKETGYTGTEDWQQQEPMHLFKFIGNVVRHHQGNAAYLLLDSCLPVYKLMYRFLESIDERDVAYREETKDEEKPRPVNKRDGILFYFDPMKINRGTNFNLGPFQRAMKRRIEESDSGR